MRDYYRRASELFQLATRFLLHHVPRGEAEALPGSAAASRSRATSSSRAGGA